LSACCRLTDALGVIGAQRVQLSEIEQAQLFGELFTTMVLSATFPVPRITSISPPDLPAL
jgi:hypothetical protein